MATDPVSYMDAADDFLSKMEASKLVAKAELETVRKGLVRDIKREAKDTVKSLQTTRIGAAKVLIPNASNLKKIGLSSERVRSKMQSFRLNYLNRDQVTALTDAGTMPEDTSKFIRHSRRLARHAREFLTKIKEESPELQEEIDATLLQMEDNDMDLLKLEVKSMTRMKETMLRAVNGQKERGQVLKEIEDWDLNKQLFNLSILEHPDAVVRNLFANASTRQGSATATKTSEIPKRSHVFVGLPPQAAAKLKPNSRTADFSWRLFDQKTLNEKFKNLPSKQGSPSSWRGLGLDYNTKEFYLPVPPSMVTGLTPLVTARRAQTLGAGAAARAAVMPPDRIKGDDQLNPVSGAAGDSAGVWLARELPEQKGFLAKANDKEIESILDYKAGDALEINDLLRADRADLLGKRKQGMVESLDGLLDKTATSKDLVVYRQSTHPAFKKLKADDTFNEKGYSSTSLIRDHKKFGEAAEEIFDAKAVQLVINVPKGSKGAYLDFVEEASNREDAEFLLPRGVKYTVTKVEQRNDRKQVFVDIEPLDTSER